LPKYAQANLPRKTEAARTNRSHPVVRTGSKVAVS
jgi:hypothetical protein